MPNVYVIGYYTCNMCKERVRIVADSPQAPGGYIEEHSDGEDPCLGGGLAAQPEEQTSAHPHYAGSARSS